MSDLEGIEEIADQTSIRINEGSRSKHGKLGWDISPNIARAAAAHEPKPIAVPTEAAQHEPIPAPAANDPVTSYTELMTAIQAQVGVLGVRLVDFDVLAGFPAGLSGKVFGMLQVKRLGPEKMFDALRAAGLRLRVEVDPEQFDRMKARIEKKMIHPRQANQARNGHSASPAGPAVLSRIFKPLAKMGGKARMASMTKDEMRAHQRAAAMAGVLKRRKEARKRLKAAHRRRQRERTALVSTEVASA